jgi:hypothetical protein
MNIVERPRRARRLSSTAHQLDGDRGVKIRAAAVGSPQEAGRREGGPTGPIVARLWAGGITSWGGIGWYSVGATPNPGHRTPRAVYAGMEGSGT